LSEAPGLVYLNGDYLLPQDAKISVMDRGFLYGDGIYEVIPVFNGRPLRLDAHLQRLQNSLDRISLANPNSNTEWHAIFEQLLDKNPGDDRAIYLQLTRGEYPKRDLSISTEYAPTVFSMVMHVPAANVARISKGIAVITVDDFRWNACDIKSISLIANVMIRQQAAEAGVEDAIMLKGGMVTEGTASNVFIVKNGALKTPPLGRNLLSGITRDLVIEIARNASITVEEKEISKAELFDADEVWMTSSTREIAPVITINGETVGNGVPGRIWQQVTQDYQRYKSALKQSL
jgi:D-alanine transaminase